MPNCVELGNCALGANPLDQLVVPYQQIIGDWIFVLVWGLVVGVISIRVSPMYGSFIGLFIAAMFLGTNVYNSSITNGPFYYGYILVAISFGASMYFLIRGRLQNP